MEPPVYKQAVCLNGHQKSIKITETSDYQPFCEDCGSKVISHCSTCNTPIPGSKVKNYYFFSLEELNTPIPKYCTGCGTPFPWLN